MGAQARFEPPHPAPADPAAEEVPAPGVALEFIDHLHRRLYANIQELGPGAAEVSAAFKSHQERLPEAPVQVHGVVCRVLPGSLLDLLESAWAKPSLRARIRFIGRDGEHVAVSLTLALPEGDLGGSMLRVVLAAFLPGLNPCADAPPPEGRNAAEQDVADPAQALEGVAFKCSSFETAAVLLEEATLAGGHACGACRDEGGTVTLALEFGEAAAAKAAREAAGGRPPAAQFRARPRVAALL